MERYRTLRLHIVKSPWLSWWPQRSTSLSNSRDLIAFLKCDNTAATVTPLSRWLAPWQLWPLHQPLDMHFYILPSVDSRTHSTASCTTDCLIVLLSQNACFNSNLLSAHQSELHTQQQTWRCLCHCQCASSPSILYHFRAPIPMGRTGIGSSEKGMMTSKDSFKCKKSVRK